MKRAVVAATVTSLLASGAVAVVATAAPSGGTGWTGLRAGVGVVDASWHLGAGAGQYHLAALHPAVEIDQAVGGIGPGLAPAMLGRPVDVEAAAAGIALARQRQPILPDRAARIEILDQTERDELLGPGRIDVPMPDPEIELPEFGRGTGGRGRGSLHAGWT